VTSSYVIGSVVFAPRRRRYRVLAPDGVSESRQDPYLNLVKRTALAAVGGFATGLVAMYLLARRDVIAALDRRDGSPRRTRTPIGRVAAAIRREWSEQLDEALSMATRDGLTAAQTRSMIVGELFGLVERANREWRSIGVAMLDVDDFKAVNDRHGHAAGDVVLRSVAESIQRMLPVGGNLGRYGGDEFLLTIEDYSVTRTLELCEAIRERVQGMQISVGDETVSVTLSVGLAVGGKGLLRTDNLVKDADAALYAAKAAGRNRVVAAGA